MSIPKIWTLYCHTHINSGRRYIGLTSQTIEARWKNHTYISKSAKGGRWHFPNAIRKYGPEAFSHEVLAQSWTLEFANATEEELILQYDTRNPKKGFNILKGGGSQPNPIHKNPWNNHEYREKRIIISKELWTRPGFRSNQIMQKAKFNNLAYKTKQGLTTLLLFQDPEYRAKQLPHLLAHVAKQRAKTHCKNGHEFTESNTRRKGNVRICRRCKADWARKRRLDCTVSG